MCQTSSHACLAITLTHMNRFWLFLAKMLRREWAMKKCFIFPPHLTCASTFPGKRRNREIASIHLNAVLPTNTKRTKYHLISVHSWDTIHCRSYRQYYLIKYQMLLNVLLKTVLSPSKTVHRPAHDWVQHSPTGADQNSQLHFYWTITSLTVQCLTPLTMRFTELYEYSSMSMSCSKETR